MYEVVGLSLPDYIHFITRLTRQQHPFHLIVLPTSYMTSFFPRTIQEWNSLPPELSNLDSFQIKLYSTCNVCNCLGSISYAVCPFSTVSLNFWPPACPFNGRRTAQKFYFGLGLSWLLLCYELVDFVLEEPELSGIVWVLRMVLLLTISLNHLSC